MKPTRPRASATAVLAVANFLALSSQAFAQPRDCVGWTQQYPPHAPLSRAIYGLAYDGGRDIVTLFGGYAYGGYNQNDTWEWDGNDWTQRATTGPSVRLGPGMTYDAARGVVLLFGGQNGAQYYGDTWSWNGTTWTLLTTTGPSARMKHGMAYDVNRQVVVLFGGYDGSTQLADTWEWNGSTWALRSTTGPSAREGLAMDYDSARGVVVLFGGEGPGGAKYGDTWEWNGSSWTLRATTGPAARVQHALAYDAAHGVTVLFGGNNGSAVLDDTWTWDGSNWSLQSVPGPGPRWYHRMVYQSTRAAMLLFGGAAYSFLGDTWEYGGVPPFITQQPWPDWALTGNDAIFTVNAGGTLPLSYQWRKDGEPLVDDDRISGSQSNTLVIFPVQLDDAGSYDVVVTNPCDSLASTMAPMRVNHKWLHWIWICAGQTSVTAIDCTEDGDRQETRFVAGDQDGTVKERRFIENGQDKGEYSSALLAPKTRARGPVLDFEYSSGRDRVVVVLGDPANCVRRWTWVPELKKWACEVIDLKADDGATVTCVAVQDNARIAYATSDSKVKIADLGFGDPECTLPTPGAVGCVAFTPTSGDQLVAGCKVGTEPSATGKVRIWNTNGWQQAQADLDVGPVGGPGVQDVAISKNGRWLAVVPHPKTPPGKVLLYEKVGNQWVKRKEWSEPVDPPPPIAVTSNVAFTDDAQTPRLAWGDSAGQVRWADLPPGLGDKTVPAFGNGPFITAVRTIGNDRVICGTDTGKLARVSRDRQTVTDLTCGAHTGPVSSAATPSGLGARTLGAATLASCGDDDTVKLWNLRTGELLHTLTGHSWGVRSVAFSPDGQIVASGAGDCTVRLWDAETGDPIRPLTGPTDWVWSAAFSPDGQMIAAGTYNGDETIWLWTVDGQFIRRFVGHAGPINSVAFSPDGQLLASAGAWPDVSIKIWRVSDGELLHTLYEHSFSVGCVVFSPDGQTLASSSVYYDHSIRLWRTSDWTQRHALFAHEDGVPSLAFSPDGKVLASASWDATVKFWQVSDGALLMSYREEMGSSATSVAWASDQSLWAYGRADATVVVARNPFAGDLNCDYVVDFADINPFVLRLTNPGGYAAQYPDCPDANGDLDTNGTVGFEDINPFVDLLVQ